MLKIDVVIFTHNAMRDEIIKKKKVVASHRCDTTRWIDICINRCPIRSILRWNQRPCLLRGREIGKIIERETRGIILYSGLTSWQLRTWRRVVGAGCGTWRGWTECRRHSRNFCFAVSINDRFNKPAYRPTTTPRDGQIENFSIKKFMQRLC